MKTSCNPKGQLWGSDLKELTTGRKSGDNKKGKRGAFTSDFWRYFSETSTRTKRLVKTGRWKQELSLLLGAWTGIAGIHFLLNNFLVHFGFLPLKHITWSLLAHDFLILNRWWGMESWKRIRPLSLEAAQPRLTISPLKYGEMIFFFLPGFCSRMWQKMEWLWEQASPHLRIKLSISFFCQERFFYRVERCWRPHKIFLCSPQRPPKLQIFCCEWTKSHLEKITVQYKRFHIHNILLIILKQRKSVFLSSFPEQLSFVSLLSICHLYCKNYS